MVLLYRELPFVVWEVGGEYGKVTGRSDRIFFAILKEIFECISLNAMLIETAKLIRRDGVHE